MALNHPLENTQSYMGHMTHYVFDPFPLRPSYLKDSTLHLFITLLRPSQRHIYPFIKIFFFLVCIFVSSLSVLRCCLLIVSA